MQTEPDARLRLLDAAELLLREQGYERTSIRAVNKAAGMNPAAVHYHFGSKPALVTALLEDRLRRSWDGPLADLTGTPPDIGQLARVLVEPMAALAADESRGWLLALLARLVLAGHPLPWRSPWPAPEPWIEIVRRAVPGLSERDAADRWRLARDLVLITYGAPLAEPGHPPEPPPARTVIAFVAAGLAAEGDPHDHDLRARATGAADPA
ncbi:TetR/AcrR family transcriptional regulator [Actinomadura barringtoniae]|uniref:TetR/AcrR family transcriptional regulator n=1 Tax=Actinomadura barringtoniae TaxID=1427535 RepID=A0A939TDT9_9ACTN|nr:TetR/AcrR family transcriptional regulator [Actinomadura barringtoniae]MBO2452635.1 TetR/AcrR family transcriptional regulator [Actinomadura barringtoniae]